MTLPAHLQLRVVSADRMLINEPVDEVVIPGSDGYFGVLPGHTPLLAMLHVGQLSYRRAQETRFLAVANGFAEVRPDEVTVLAEFAERADDIDVARAEAAKQRAEQRLATVHAQVDIDAERARIALLKSLIRLQVASRARIRS